MYFATITHNHRHEKQLCIASSGFNADSILSSDNGKY